MHNKYLLLVIIGLMFTTIGTAMLDDGLFQYGLVGIGIVILAVSVFKLIRMDANRSGNRKD